MVDDFEKGKVDMSKYLGFDPTEKPDYFFVSYNSEDKNKVGKIASQLFHANMPLWYDHGLEYGEKWEGQIVEKIKKSQAVILFFTKGILKKTNSFVRKEYDIATNYLDKKVYVVMMDKIENYEIPDDKLLWWTDIQEHQILDIADLDCDQSVEKILEATGISTHIEKMNLLIAEYRNRYENGETEEAERFLSEYLHGQNLAGKAQLIANIICGGMPGSIISSSAVKIQDIQDEDILNKIGINGKVWNECFQMKIGNNQFTIINEILGFSPTDRDPHIIKIWRDDEKIHGIYGFINAENMQVYYDECDNVIFIILSSTATVSSGFRDAVSVITVEDPLNEAICNTFRYIREGTL